MEYFDIALAGWLSVMTYLFARKRKADPAPPPVVEVTAPLVRSSGRDKIRQRLAEKAAKCGDN